MATDRFALPQIESGQAQKEVTHNEALALIDMGLHPVAQSSGVNTPPASPAVGQCWLIGANPTGVWSGCAGQLAGWTSGGWRFVSPVEAMAVWLVDQQCWAYWRAGAWVMGDVAVRQISVAGKKVLGAQSSAIAAPIGGTVIDSQLRSTVGEILLCLRTHGLIAS